MGYSSESTPVLFPSKSDKQHLTPCQGNDKTACTPPQAPGYGYTSTTLGKEQSHIQPTMLSSRVVVTFVTTDKNPSVVFPSDPVPRYSQPGGGGRLTVQEHHTVSSELQSKNRAMPGTAVEPQSAKQIQPKATYAVTARGPQVIINDRTYSDLEPGQTKTVTVDEGTFTIYPSVVVGAGATVTKPEPVPTAVSVMTPTSAMIGGLPVVVSGSEAVIDGTRIEIPPAGTTAEVHDEHISIFPGKVIIDGQTLRFQASGARQTDVVVTGGEMITAIGQSVYVFRSTTLTYGSGTEEKTEIVDDDTVTIGPSGVVIQGITMGGPSAETIETSHEIVGGATITKMSPSLVVIGGTTYTVGPSARSTSILIGGETITLASEGLIVSTMTLSYPFGSSVVTTIMQEATGDADLPEESGSSKNGKQKVSDDQDAAADDGDGDGDGDGSSGGDELTDDDNRGHSLQPSVMVVMTGLGMAMGVWVLL